MFDDSLAHLEREIQAGEVKVALLELLDNSQGVEIVIEAVAMLAHARVELPLAGVAEGRMADVMDEREGFSEVGVEFQGSGHGARNLRHFERVREPVPEMIGEARRENLRFRFEAAKGAGMDHAVAIARVVVAVGML
jgi:hypothetical protein